MSLDDRLPDSESCVRNNVVAMDQHDDEAAMALWTERRLFPTTHTLTGCEAACTGKALLVRPPDAPLRTRTRVSLDPVTTEQDWHDYTHKRLQVEAEFGVDQAQTQMMLADLRARAQALGLCLYLARDTGRLVGAIAHFRLPAPHRHWARLQEVDVFPSWRGRGLATPYWQRCSGYCTPKAPRWSSWELMKTIGR